MLFGRGMVPHVRQSKRRSASSNVVGAGGETKARGVEAGTVSVGPGKHSTIYTEGLPGTRKACSL